MEAPHFYNIPQLLEKRFTTWITCNMPSVIRVDMTQRRKAHEIRHSSHRLPRDLALTVLFQILSSFEYFGALSLLTLLERKATKDRVLWKYRLSLAYKLMSFEIAYWCYLNCSSNDRFHCLIETVLWLEGLQSIKFNVNIDKPTHERTHQRMKVYRCNHNHHDVPRYIQNKLITFIYFMECWNHKYTEYRLFFRLKKIGIYIFRKVLSEMMTKWMDFALKAAVVADYSEASRK